MKKALLLLAYIIVVIACNSSTSTATTENSPSVKKANPDAEKGLSLVAKSDCISCHNVAAAGIGPSYEAIAAKYPDDNETTISLSQKIIKGGAGNWGSVPMMPHNDLSPDDARLMVKYILSLKK